ncbi:hypothetical protein FHQ08_09135 [Lactobacillus sp. CC-MHH1034]|nr:hypothetical protein [Agrilactobacillus fermenti]
MAANLLKLTLKVNVIFRKSIVKKIIVVFRFNISLKTTIILFCVAYVPATFDSKNAPTNKLDESYYHSFSLK